MSNDDYPLPEALLALVAVIAGYLLILRIMFSYSFKEDGIRIFLFGIEIKFIAREQIAWAQVATWFQFVSCIIPDGPKRWSPFVFCRANSYFKNLLIIKTTNNRYWILTPAKPEEACWLYADNADECPSSEMLIKSK